MAKQTARVGAASSGGQDREPPFKKSTVREYFESICIAVILALFVRKIGRDPDTPRRSARCQNIRANHPSNPSVYGTSKSRKTAEEDPFALSHPPRIARPIPPAIHVNSVA
jgi:hypothetical protein